MGDFKKFQVYEKIIKKFVFVDIWENEKYVIKTLFTFRFFGKVLKIRKVVQNEQVYDANF